MKLASSTALDGLAQNGFLIDRTGSQLLVDIVEAQATHSIRKTFAGDTLVAEQQDCLLDHIHDLFFGGEDLGQRLAMGNLLTPPTADEDLKSVLIFLKRTEGELADAAAAVVTCVGIHMDLAVRQEAISIALNEVHFAESVL